MKKEIEREFRLLCERVGRRGVIGFTLVEGVRLMPEQAAYLQRKLEGLGPWSDITAVSIGLLYHEVEILAIPAGWVSKPPEDGRWSQYARAYTELNWLLNHIVALRHRVRPPASLIGQQGPARLRRLHRLSGGVPHPATGGGLPGEMPPSLAGTGLGR